MSLFGRRRIIPPQRRRVAFLSFLLNVAVRVVHSGGILFSSLLDIGGGETVFLGGCFSLSLSVPFIDGGRDNFFFSGCFSPFLSRSLMGWDNFLFSGGMLFSPFLSRSLMGGGQLSGGGMLFSPFLSCFSGGPFFSFPGGMLSGSTFLSGGCFLGRLFLPGDAF